MSRHLTALVSLLVASGGCKEMSDAFEGTQDDQLTRQKREREEAERASEAARQNRERLTAEMEAMSAQAGQGPEPTARPERVLWLVQARIACGSAACSDDVLKRLRVLGDISAELRPLLDRDDAATRSEAIRLVGLLKLPGLGLRLAAALTDPAAHVRRAACHALEWLADPEAIPGIVKHMGARREDHLCLIGALGATPGAAAARVLARDATGEDATIAASAVHALEKRRSDDAVLALEEAVALSSFSDVKRAAVEALASIPSKVAKAALGRAAKSRDPAVRRFVKEAGKD